MNAGQPNCAAAFLFSWRKTAVLIEKAEQAPPKTAGRNA